MEISNLAVIGTIHISSDSADKIRKSIQEITPDIVAVELDKNRLYGLTHKQKEKIDFSLIRRIGVSGFVFVLIGKYVQKKLAKVVNTKPGVDMLAAVHEAKENNLMVALIDQDIEVTLKRLSAKITFREKWNFFVDIIKGLLFPKRQIKQLGLESFDLTKVPEQELITKLLYSLKDRYPNIFLVLVHERNHYMANSLYSIMNTFPDKKVLAVVGAGHMNEMMDILEKKVNAQSKTSENI